MLLWTREGFRTYLALGSQEQLRPIVCVLRAALAYETACVLNITSPKHKGVGGSLPPSRVVTETSGREELCPVTYTYQLLQAAMGQAHYLYLNDRFLGFSYLFCLSVLDVASLRLV